MYVYIHLYTFMIQMFQDFPQFCTRFSPALRAPEGRFWETWQTCRTVANVGKRLRKPWQNAGLMVETRGKCWLNAGFSWDFLGPSGKLSLDCPWKSRLVRLAGYKKSSAKLPGAVQMSFRSIAHGNFLSVSDTQKAPEVAQEGYIDCGRENYICRILM